MSQGLGMSLDDYIKASKPSRGGGYTNNYSGRYKSGGGNYNKPQRYNKPQGGGYRNRFKRNDEFEGSSGAFNKKRHWEHDRFEGPQEENKDFEYEKPQRFSRSPQENNSSFSTKSAIQISNLHYAIIDKDLRELFDQFGEITRCEIDWDEIGRSKGTAIIQFIDEEAAKKAIQEYNGAELDGQKLLIEIYKKEVPMLRRTGGIQKERFRSNRGGGFPMRKNFNNRRFN